MSTFKASAFDRAEFGPRQREREALVWPAGLHKLRPAKVHQALRRRWFENVLPQTLAFRGVVGLVDIGSKPGGWTFPVDLIEPDWTCYMVGAGGDIQVDLDLIERCDVTVRSFDAVGGYVSDALRDADGDPRFSAYHAAIGLADGPVQMQVTHHPGSRSVSSAGMYESDNFIEVPGRSLPSIMDELGDKQVDLLKLDIEGAEYEVLPRLDLQSLGVKVFSTQFHHNGSVRAARRVIRGLCEQGYELVACRPAIKLTFLRRDLA